MTFFSVIIPTYNRAHLLAETIDTVLQQSFPHFEVIIVDDGSTDNTREVLEKKYSGDRRVRYFHKRNEERGAARNFGLQQAKGKYAVFFDSDDWMKSHYLEVLKNEIERKPGIGFLAAKYNYINLNKEEYNSELKLLAEGWYGRNFFLQGNILACNYCIKIMGSFCKPFPEDRKLASMEDWLFILLNLEKEKIFIKNDICITMRQHDERSMMNNKKVIDARREATRWVLNNLCLNTSEQIALRAWSHYFCAIHYYLDFNRGASVNETIAAIKLGGLKKKFLLLLLKSILGRRVIKIIK
jgi:glycosyltransferase involved in cell wall biosynthesis